MWKKIQRILVNTSEWYGHQEGRVCVRVGMLCDMIEGVGNGKGKTRKETLRASLSLCALKHCCLLVSVQEVKGLKTRGGGCLGGTGSL